MIRAVVTACVLVACQPPTVDVEYRLVDGGPPAADGGADFLSTGMMTAGLAVAIVALSSSGAVDVTSTNGAVLEALPTTTGGFLIIAHTAGTATLDFTVNGDLVRTIPVMVVP